MKLLPNEEKLIVSNQDKIILTDHRIQMTDRIMGQSYTISIFLEDISSIEIKYKSDTLLLVSGVICVLFALFLGGEVGGSVGLLGFVLGIILVALWWFNRKHIVSISSKGGSALNFTVQGMGDEKIHDFIHNVSIAKQKRVNHLHQNIITA